MDSVLVTGASGFIGSHLARRLALAGLHVVGISTSRERAWRLRDLPANFTLAQMDLRDADSLRALFAAHRFTKVFHLAAHGVQAPPAGTSPDPCILTAVNSQASFALGEAALRHKIQRFVYCGSGLEYQNLEIPVDEFVPLRASSLYGSSKSAGWLLLDYLQRVEGLPVVTVRPFTVFGPAESNNKLIPYVIRSGLRREAIQLGAGTGIRDYVYVSDVVEALVLASEENVSPGETFNIGSGLREARTIRSIVETTLDLIGAPRSLCRFGEARRTRIDPLCLVSDPARAAVRLGWVPSFSLERGLRETIEWHKVSFASKIAVGAAA